ncbi:hypothetical protein BDY19DRAFT_999075 [Irpex rosettiformis]|uniref:Uncharacterized protein n=1 Tax=Irpex rosettiformis TaxID=378272 RepID=A0ACB8TLN9_9APHY|nr:hypothetical protein BDY19DRAFT_999075 [Irpex rosettiformis]
MHTKDGGMDKFILVDSGFSILVDESSMSLPVGSPLRHHTRMLPFMARELVSDMAASQSSWRRSAHRPVQHCIRHDFESLFWVSLWCAIAVVSPGMEDPAQKIKGLKFLATWEMPSLRSTADRKHAIITDGGDALKKVPLSPSFKHLREWFRAFRSCFFEALVAQFRWKERKDTAPPFESFETGHGNVTRDEIFEAFTRYDESESVV